MATSIESSSTPISRGGWRYQHDDEQDRADFAGWTRAELEAANARQPEGQEMDFSDHPAMQATDDWRQRPAAERAALIGHLPERPVVDRRRQIVLGARVVRLGLAREDPRTREVGVVVQVRAGGACVVAWPADSRTGHLTMVDPTPHLPVRHYADGCGQEVWARVLQHPYDGAVAPITDQPTLPPVPPSHWDRPRQPEVATADVQDPELRAAFEAMERRYGA